MLLLFWSTGGKLHSIDTTSVTLAGLAIMLLPGIGVMSWKEVEKTCAVGHVADVWYWYQPGVHVA
ncbi:Citrate Succinate antiporter (TC 2.A.47.3.2) [Escherichia coli ISC41]|nr:Citrate Succinate antiporter (TC 2.A.47.3.2) [Escherichia coli ISC41]